MPKGASFERQICKTLSLWWTGGKRDDVFWRSSQSGGRATQRAKSGKTTFGSWGDIAAVDPIGLPLLKLVTIELKRGYSKHSPQEIFDAPKRKKVGKNSFAHALLQSERCARAAGSVGWMLIHRRDRKTEIAYFSHNVVAALHECGIFGRPPVVRYDLAVMPGNVRVKFVGIPLHQFLARVNAQQIRVTLRKF